MYIFSFALFYLYEQSTPAALQNKCYLQSEQLMEAFYLQQGQACLS